MSPDLAPQKKLTGQEIVAFLHAVTASPPTAEKPKRLAEAGDLARSLPVSARATAE